MYFSVTMIYIIVYYKLLYTIYILLYRKTIYKTVPGFLVLFTVYCLLFLKTVPFNFSKQYHARLANITVNSKQYETSSKMRSVKGKQ